MQEFCIRVFLKRKPWMTKHAAFRLGAESSTAQPDITWRVVYGGLHVRWLRVIFPTGTQQVYGKAFSTSQTQGPDGILERAFRDLAHKPSTHIPWPVGAICENAFHWLLICIQVGYQTAWSQYVCGLKVSFPYAHRLSGVALISLLVCLSA